MHYCVNCQDYQDCANDKARACGNYRAHGISEEDYHAAKFDQGKTRYDLIPEICAREIMRGDSKYAWARVFHKVWDRGEGWRDPLLEVLLYGLEKYSEDSWKTVPNAQNRYWGAYCRHRASSGDDPESGIPHLHHRLCNIMFLLWFEIKEDKPHLFEEEKSAMMLPAGTVASWEAKDIIALMKQELEFQKNDKAPF